MSEPQQYVLGLAYAAGRDPNITKGADGRRDYFTADELEKAAWGFLGSAAEIGLFHSDQPTAMGHARVVESYIFRGDDWDLGTGTIIRKGDWLVGAICDDVAWSLVKAGHVTGFSMQGKTQLRKAT